MFVFKKMVIYSPMYIFFKTSQRKEKACMKKYVLGLLLIVHNVCAMEMEPVNNKKKLSKKELLEKHSRNPNQKIRIGKDYFLPMNIHRQLPFELQKNIFVMMYEKYNTAKERFIASEVGKFKCFVDRGNEDWEVRVVLRDNYILLLKRDIRQLLNTAEHHSFCQKNNTDKSLEVSGYNYTLHVVHLNEYSSPPKSFEVIDKTEGITTFVKEHYDRIILFWYIVNKKKDRFV